MLPGFSVLATYCGDSLRHAVSLCVCVGPQVIYQYGLIWLLWIVVNRILCEKLAMVTSFHVGCKLCDHSLYVCLRLCDRV